MHDCQTCIFPLGMANAAGDKAPPGSSGWPSASAAAPRGRCGTHRLPWAGSSAAVSAGGGCASATKGGAAARRRTARRDDLCTACRRLRYRRMTNGRSVRPTDELIREQTIRSRDAAPHN